MHPENERILDSALCDAVAAVFLHYGIELVPKGRSPANKVVAHDAVGVIGFAGEQVRGTLVISSTTALIAQSCPETGDQVTTERDRVRDWIGELTNMVLGRIKIDFARHGIVVGLSIPVAFTGESLRIGAVQASRTRSWDFTSPQGDLRCWLEVEISSGLILVQSGSGVDSELAAGEPVFFD